MDRTPLFQYPLSDTVARSLIVHPKMKKYGFKEPIDVIRAVETYPLPNLIFTKAYEALAESFNLKILHKWQLGIETEIKRMLRKHYPSGLKSLEQYTQPE